MLQNLVHGPVVAVMFAEGHSLPDLITGLRMGQVGPWVVLITIATFVVASYRYQRYHVQDEAETEQSEAYVEPPRDEAGAEPRRRIVGAPSGSLIIRED